MAVIYNQQNQNDDDNNQPAPQTGGGTGSTITGGTGGGQGAAGPSGRKARKGGFVGINRYMQAQQDAGGRMAGRIAGNLEQQGTQAKQGIGNLSQNFQTKSAQDLDAKKQALNTLKTDSTKFTDDQAQTIIGGYKGPANLQDVEGYGDTAQQVGKLKTSLDQTATGAGRQKLTRDQFGGAGYTGGMGRLDSALIGVDEGARSQFAGLRDSLGGVGDQLTQAQTDAQQLASQRQAEALGIKGDATETISQKRAALEKSLQETMASANQKAQEDFLRQKELLAGNKYSAEQYKRDPADEEAAQKYFADRKALMSELGLTDTDMMKSRGGWGGMERGSINDYLKGPGEYNVSQAATEEQRAKDSALARIAGQFGMGDQTTRFTGDNAGGPAGVSVDRGRLDQQNRIWDAAAQNSNDAQETQRLAREKAKQDLADRKAADLALRQREAEAKRMARLGQRASGKAGGIMGMSVPNLATAINRW